VTQPVGTAHSGGEPRAAPVSQAGEQTTLALSYDSAGALRLVVAPILKRSATSPLSEVDGASATGRSFALWWPESAGPEEDHCCPARHIPAPGIRAAGVE